MDECVKGLIGLLGNSRFCDSSNIYSGIFLWLNSSAVMSKKRFWLFMTLPFLVLTIIPTILLLMVDGIVFDVLKYILWVNAIIAGSDIINSVLIAIKPTNEICLESFVGMAYVAEHNGVVTGDDALEIIGKAKKQNTEAAKVFASSDILLLGNEPQTIGPQNAPMAVHLVLLGANVILLEGIRLSEVSEGVYFLNAAPLNLSGLDGSPCRAILIAVER